MTYWALIVSFAPWIIYQIIRSLPLHQPDLQLRIAIVVSAIVTVYQMRNGTHRGAILWSALIVFVFQLVTIVIFDMTWLTQYTSLMSNLILAGSVWITMLLGRPFTLEYAKQYVDEQYWQAKPFLQRNYLITTVWALAFTVNLVVSIIRLFPNDINEAIFSIINNAAIVFAIIFTVKKSQAKK